MWAFNILLGKIMKALFSKAIQKIYEYVDIIKITFLLNLV